MVPICLLLLLVMVCDGSPLAGPGASPALCKEAARGQGGQEQGGPLPFLLADPVSCQLYHLCLASLSQGQEAWTSSSAGSCGQGAVFTGTTCSQVSCSRAAEPRWCATYPFSFCSSWPQEDEDVCSCAKSPAGGSTPLAVGGQREPMSLEAVLDKVFQPEPELEEVSEPEPEPELDPTPEPVPEFGLKPELKPELESDPNPEPASELVSEPQPEQELEADKLNSEPEKEDDAGPKPEPESESLISNQIDTIGDHLLVRPDLGELTIEKLKALEALVVSNVENIVSSISVSVSGRAAGRVMGQATQ